MGWLYTRQTKEQLISALLRPRSDDNLTEEVLEHHLAAGDVLWSLVRVTARDTANPEALHNLQPGESRVYIRCDLLEVSGEGWGFKALDETVSPFYWSCPLHYLDLAPEQSPDWRAGVRKFHAKRARLETSRPNALARSRV